MWIFSTSSKTSATPIPAALTVALALAPLAVGTRDEHAFNTQFLSH